MAKTRKKYADPLAAYFGHIREPDDVVLGAPGPAELGVLLVPDHRQVRADERQDDARYQQDMDDVEALDDLGARVIAAEQQEAEPGPDEGDRLDDGVADAHAGAGEQVVGQRVADEPFDDAQREQGDADRPVQLAGLAEGAGEEHPAQVHGDGGDEQQRAPVVNLAHHQAGPHVEADVAGSRRRPG